MNTKLQEEYIMIKFVIFFSYTLDKRKKNFFGIKTRAYFLTLLSLIFRVRTITLAQKKRSKLCFGFAKTRSPIGSLHLALRGPGYRPPQKLWEDPPKQRPSDAPGA